LEGPFALYLPLGNMPPSNLPRTLSMHFNSSKDYRHSHKIF